MDPNPASFPILSYVMSRFSRLGSFKAPETPVDIHDVERQTPAGRYRRSLEDDIELMERMPRLQHPALLASMAAAISDVSQSRAVLRGLGKRPDHEAVDSARARIAEIDADLSIRIPEIASTRRPEGVDLERWQAELEEREKECSTTADREKATLRIVVQLDEMHEAYERLLREAEERLEQIYDAGGAENPKEGSLMEKVEEVDEAVDEEVIAILRQGSENSLEKVDLSSRQLRHLPEAFGKLRGLISLNLSNNQLEVIPDAIAGLECLEELQLSSNFLTSLPDSIGLLLSLMILNVSGNKLKSLPDSIAKCRSLVELDASYNDLAYLPTNIGYELQNLEQLRIHLNKIRSLPTSVCEMKSLRLLDAHFNELRGLPHAIGKLTNLEILNLSRNFTDLQDVPASLGDLMNLRELDLSNNQIRALPDTFGRLDKLTKLGLDENPLVIPPTEVVVQGVEAVKAYMAKRWIDTLIEEERKSSSGEASPTQVGWLTRSTSWLYNWVSGVGTAEKQYRDPCLDQQF